MSVDHTKNIIEIQDVSFAYGDNLILKNISLNIHQGDYLGIIGPNGSGKTTLLKIMLGLLKPAAGRVKLFGEKCEDFTACSRLGYVPQKAINFDPLFPATVYEVVTMGRYGRNKILKRLNNHDYKIIDESLRQVEMFNFKNKMIGDLSSGQQQRVFIARALASEPEVIFLDEPTVGVDVVTQEKFYALLKKLNRDFGLTLVLISHDTDVITNEVTEIACINQTLIYYGESAKFINGGYLKKLYGKNIRHISHNH